VLPPLLAQLQAEHPALTVELVLSNRVHDLLQREADIAIRMTEPRQDALIARRVGTIPLGLYAHPSYIAAHGTPATLAELAHHRLIGFDAETPFLRAAQKALPAWRRDRFAVRSDSDVAQLAFIRAGAGIGICQDALARRSAPALVRVLPQWRLDGASGIYFVRPSAAFSSAAMTALRDCLVRWFATRSPWRTGHDTLAPPLSSCASAP